MGILSSYSGVLLWALFLRLDSLRYPVKTYADVAERIFGRFARRICNILQAMQLLIAVCFSTATMCYVIVYLIFAPQVGATCLALGQGFSQIIRGRVSIAIANDELRPEPVSYVFWFALSSS